MRVKLILAEGEDQKVSSEDYGPLLVDIKRLLIEARKHSPWGVYGLFKCGRSELANALDPILRKLKPVKGVLGNVARDTLDQLDREIETAIKTAPQKHVAAGR